MKAKASKSRIKEFSILLRFTLLTNNFFKIGDVLKSRNVLNQYLKDYGFDYCIGVGTEKRKVYWVIEKQK